MRVPDPITAKISIAKRPSGRRRVRELARRALWHLAPSYAGRRSQRVAAALGLERLEAEVEQMRRRHDEQIERLEDLVRELVLTAEALRRDIVRGERRDEA